jgi:hypothetical protein
VSIANYGELKTAAANWLSRADLTSRIPEFIEGGLQRINNELIANGGLADQEQVAFASTVANQESLEEPIRYGNLRSVWISDRPLEPRSYHSLLELHGNVTGEPEKYAYMDGAFYFRPIPNAVYTVRINYNRRYASFTADGNTNYLLTSGGNVLLYATLLEATPFVQDDKRVEMWAAAYKEAMRLLVDADHRARYGHFPPELQTDTTLRPSRNNILIG